MGTQSNDTKIRKGALNLKLNGNEPKILSHVIDLAMANGCNCQIASPDDLDFYETVDAAVTHLNQYCAPTGFYFGQNSLGDWGFWPYGQNNATAICIGFLDFPLCMRWVGSFGSLPTFLKLTLFINFKYFKTMDDYKAYLAFYTEMQRVFDTNMVKEAFNNWQHMVDKWNNESRSGSLLHFCMQLDMGNIKKLETYFMEKQYPIWKEKHPDYFPTPRPYVNHDEVKKINLDTDERYKGVIGDANGY